MNRNVGLKRVPFPRNPESVPLGRNVPLRSASRITGSRGPDFPAAESGVPATIKKAATRRSATGFSPAVKLLTCTRAGHGDPDMAMCEACGTWVGQHEGEHQHIVARGMGGCKLAVINSAANDALLCRRCHRLAESRDPHMEAAGFWARQGADPRLLPMMLGGAGGSGITVWRAEDGKGPDGTGYLFQCPEAVAA